MNFTPILSHNLIPDPLVRTGIRRLLRRRLREERQATQELQQAKFMEFVKILRSSPIATHTADANVQHYELPTAFFSMVLGKHMKYSSGYWTDGTQDLTAAEHAMLELTCSRAQLKNGQSVLELGCGWGSLSLFMAERYPDSIITGVSNSSTQKAYIDSQCVQRGITNLKIITADMNTFATQGQYDRIVSVEMFEHMRNYDALLKKISGWLKEGGRLFVHIFTHKEFAYPFDVKDSSDWMAQYFFTGGIMPSDHLLLYFPEHMIIEEHWRVIGTHYQNTAEAWLKNMDAHRDEILPLLERTYGAAQTRRWWVYWRVFFMSCAELWGYNNGDEWYVSHYLFKKSSCI